MATTSSSILESSVSVTDICAVAGRVVVFIPRYETVTFAPAGTSAIEKFPLASVTAPFCVPFTDTVAPITGSLAWSTTVPLTVWACAKAHWTPRASMRTNTNFFILKLSGYSNLVAQRYVKVLRCPKNILRNGYYHLLTRYFIATIYMITICKLIYYIYTKTLI